MHAYLVEEAGGEFRRVELARPALGAGDVLVRVRASGVNPLDIEDSCGQGSACQATAAGGAGA